MATTDLPAILTALTAPRHGLAKALPNLPSVPGLYAIYGPPETWRDLGLGAPPDDRPLYVGKAEDSLVARDIATHFGNGRTGSSTVRRSFAALLRDTLDLHGMPRNPRKPDHFPNYGLSPADDTNLTAWMRARLEIAVWARHGDLLLADVEQRVIGHWQPPLNLTHVSHRWTETVKRARSAMASEARSWSQPS